jgi:Ala-tRNA(Pro) deacylase
MPATKLKEFLDSHNVKYVSITHSKAYTAQGIAAAAHISGKELAKTVMISIDGDMAMAVLPASEQVNLDSLKIALKAKKVDLASERQFRDRFADCELGAMPPFGNLYNMKVIVDETLTHDKEIAFNAGTHLELIKLAYSDFERLVQPTVLRFSRRATAQAA